MPIWNWTVKWLPTRSASRDTNCRSSKRGGWVTMSDMEEVEEKVEKEKEVAGKRGDNYTRRPKLSFIRRVS